MPGISDFLPFTLPYGQSASKPDTGMMGYTDPAPPPAQEPMPRAGAFPIGQSGRANFAGLPQPDELNPELVGPAGIRKFNEMYRQDSHLRRLILAAWSPLVAGTWTLEPYGGDDGTDQDKTIAETIWWLLNNYMSPSFTEHLYELGPVLLRSGFTPYEQIWDVTEYKGKKLLAPRSLQLRLPISVWRWWQDPFGQLTHIGQILPNKPDIILPATELVYYRLGPEGDNWPGTSLLRHAYKNWTLKDRLERIDAIGQERKAVGVPVVYPPADASDEVKTQFEQVLMNLHMSEVAYLMAPGPKAGSQGEHGDQSKEWLIEIITFDSSSGSGILDSIAYHQQGIAGSFLTDFLELGHHQVGARATAEVQEDPFLTAINGALLPPVIPPLNRLIDRIRRTNWASAEGSPTLKLTLNDEASLSEIAGYITGLVQQEVIQVDPELEDYARDRAGLPAANPDIRAQRLAARAAGLAQAAQPNDPNASDDGSQPPANQPAPAKPAGPQKPAPKPPTPAAPKQLDDEPPDPPARKGLRGAGIAVHADDTGRVLLIRRAYDESDQDDTKAGLEFPGGTIDPTDKGAWSAAKREFTEETGAKLPAHQRIGQINSPDGGYRLHVVRIPRETDLQPEHHDRGEISQTVWHPLSGIQDVLSERAKPLAGGTKLLVTATPKVTLDDHIHQPAPGADQEPTVKWWEKLLSQNELRAAFDGCRDHIQAACQPPVTALAQSMAHQAANGAPVTERVDPPQDLVDALTKHYTDLYQLGRGTVATELAAQKAHLAKLGKPVKQLDDPPPNNGPDAGDAAGAYIRASRAGDRAEHSARNIMNAIQQHLGRDTITGLKDNQALQDTAVRAGTGQLRVEALANTAAQVNDGRADEALNSQAVGAYYTAVLDNDTCDPCGTADDGTLLSPDEAVAIGPPNPNCAGGDKCRCALVWVMSDDPAALQAMAS